MATLPTFTKSVDDAFVDTWYDIKPQAMDNILNATPVWAALKMRGCLKPQTGGEMITRTIRYGQKTTTDLNRSSVLPMGTDDLETMAWWTWRYFGTHVQRNLIDDQKNQGKYKIQDYVQKRISAARDALVTKCESVCFNTIVTDETGDAVQGLNDMIPVSASRATGTYGHIARPTNFTSDVADAGNTWWTPRYYQFTAPAEINFTSDLRHLFNLVHNQQEPPDLILLTQTLYETYEDFGLESQTMVKNQKLLDLGFDTLKFKGADMVYSSSMTASNVLLLTTSYLDVVYDPTLWFDMTEWKTVPNSMDRVAHLICTCQFVSDQLRRHGRGYY